LSSPTAGAADQQLNGHRLLPPRPPQRWGSGVCACFDDMQSCE
jgi:hypothetical protein